MQCGAYFGEICEQRKNISKMEKEIKKFQKRLAYFKKMCYNT